MPPSTGQAAPKMVPSDRIAQHKGSTSLGTSLPEDRSTAGYRNVLHFLKSDDGQIKRKRDCVSVPSRRFETRIKHLARSYVIS